MFFYSHCVSLEKGGFTVSFLTGNKDFLLSGRAMPSVCVPKLSGKEYCLYRILVMSSPGIKSSKETEERDDNYNTPAGKGSDRRLNRLKQ